MKRLTREELAELDAMTRHELRVEYNDYYSMLVILRTRYYSLSRTKRLELHYTDGAPHPDDLEAPLAVWDMDDERPCADLNNKQGGTNG